MARRISTIAVVLVMVALFADVLAPDHALFFRDHATVFRRLFALVRAAYRGGELPLWDPLIGGGEPLAAYPAAVAFSPLHLITVLVPDALDPYDLFVVACYAIGARGAYFVARTCGLDARARLIAAALFAAGGPLISLNNLVPALHSAVFGPWALAAALLVWQAPSARRIAGLAVALALHAQGADPALLVCDALVFAGLLPLVRVPWARARAVGALAAATALGLALAAIQILPLLELLRGTTRAAGYTASTAWSTHPLRLAELSFAGLAGDFLDLHTLFQPDEGGRHYLASIYLGALTMPALALALGVKQARALVAVAIVCVLISLGPTTQLHAVIQAVFPGASSSRFPVKYVYGASLALPLLVPLALDFASRSRVALALLVAWILAAAALALVPAEWVLAHAGAVRLDADGARALLAGASSQTLLITALVLVVVALAAKRPALAWALPPLLALDVALAARPILPTMDPLPREPSPIARLVLADDPRPTIFRYDAPIGALDMRTDTRRGFDTLEPMGASPAGIRSMLDTDLNDIRPPQWNAARAALDGTRDEGARMRLLARLGTTHLLVSTRRRDLPDLRYVGTATVPHNHPVAVFRLEKARPWASFALAADRVPDLATAARALTATVGADVVLVDDATTRALDVIPGAPQLDAPPRITTTATITGERHDLVVDAPVPGLLVLAERYDRGWRAHVDGRPVAPLAADVMLLAVPVPAGRHRVELAYAPASVRAGVLITAIAALLTLALALRSSDPRKTA